MARLGIEPRSPGNTADEGSAGNELPGFAVENIKETVLVRLHDHFAHAPADAEVRLHQRLRRIEVPVISGSRLEIPGQFAVAGMHRENRRRIQTVASAAQGAIPRGRVARSKIQQVQGRVVDDALPGRSAAAGSPPFARPGFGGAFQGLRLEPLRRVARLAVREPSVRVVRNSELEPRTRSFRV